ncbi:putative BTB/POZ domain-containing protein KCTD16 [Scophthalmus maximus]|uniref:Putative BTB/POZ domain-containing protein KCTD16 n=1 Tax=Scophthalmus maximus TaxID=52904 RepID=A0A2U9B857_SCOMX|nr:putative BTB/POZ domain-containing protein KCTD16 [Scophthalmus maximus]
MALSGNCRTNPKEQASVQNSFPDVVELNVGGQVYYTRHSTLVNNPSSLLGKIFSSKKEASNDLARDPKGRYFVDRDGFLFRYVLDYLRDKQVVLPDHFPEKGRLRKEAEYFQLPDLVKLLTPDDAKQSPDDCFHSDHEDGSQGSDQRPCPPPSLVPADRKSGFVTVGYRGSCTAGRESQTDARFRRFKHLERAFDMLSECGFQMVACNSSVTASPVSQQHSEDKVWSSYTEYVFYRGTSRWSSPPCDCCCKNHKGDGEGESGTSFNELSTSSSESQSEASSPQGTIICGPVSRQPHAHVQTLDRPLKKGPVAMLQQSDQRRKSDLLRTLTASSRDTSTCKKRPAKEKLTAEEELDKCIQDFRKIKIPERFPERKYMWQADLLRKYRL